MRPFLFALALLLPTVTQAQPTATDTLVVCSNARVQAAPVLGGDVVSRLVAGERIPVAGMEGRFYHVVTEHAEGYVDKSFFGSCPFVEAQARGQLPAVTTPSSTTTAPSTRRASPPPRSTRRARPNCSKGKPCGNSCIARNKRCRIG